MKHIAIVLPIVVLTLAACQTPTPTAAPAAPTGVVTRAAANPTPTSLPPATPTTAPTVAPTATSTETPAAAPTASPTPSPAPAQSAAHDVYVNADSVNLRADSNTTANVLQVLSQGTHLTALDQPTAPDAAGIAWQSVRTEAGQAGWVAASLLSSDRPATPSPSPSPVAPPSGTPVVTPIAQSGYVYVASVNGLNLRADHTASAQLLATLANGQRLQTNGLGFGPDADGITWINVKADDGHEGWVAAEFVSTQVPSIAPAAPPANASDIAAELLSRTNELRQQNGLPPLTLDSGLTGLALAHSHYMAQNGITHTGAGGLSASQRIANAGYTGFPAENIFGGQASIDDAWGYWSTDPPHLANLLTTKSTLIGVGVYQAGAATYYTQDFAQPSQ